MYFNRRVFLHKYVGGNDSKRNCTLLSVPPLMSFAGRKTLEASILSTPKSFVLYEVSVCLFVFVLFLCLFVVLLLWGGGGNGGGVLLILLLLFAFLFFVCLSLKNI